MILRTPTQYQTAGRIAIVGYGACTPLGTARTTFLTRTGRFEQALPELSRLMNVPLGPDARDYIDRNIGIRIPRPSDLEQHIDLQRFEGLRDETLRQDTYINGRLYAKGSKISIPHTWKLPVVHAGVIPSGWDLLKESGFSGKPFNDFSRAHLMMMRALAEAMISMGVEWSEIEKYIAPEQRKVGAALGMGPGDDLDKGMGNPKLSRPVVTDQIARFLPDNPAFWLQKILNARHASSRLGACNTGICNTEDVVAAMRAGDILFGAVATFESLINQIAIVGFNAQKALATDRSIAMLNDHPSLISRPGLKDRSGFTLAEGGGVLLLMDFNLARQIGAIIYGEVLASHTATGDSKSLDAAAPTNGGVLSLKRGLLTAAKLDGVSPQQFVQQLDVINAHGTSTPAGDTKGIEGYDEVLKAFGRDPRNPVFVVYGKGGSRLEDIETARRVGNGGIGHLLGGAASAATVETIDMHVQGILPPSVSGLGEVDEGILRSRHLVYPTQPLRSKVRVGVTNALGFGDSNGDTWTREYNPADYADARQNAGRQADSEARRDEWIKEVESGTRKPAEFVPVIE